MSELWQLSALQLAAKIRDGATPSREELGAHLARCETADPDAQAILRRFDAEEISR